MKQIAFIGECMIELNGALFGAMSQTFGGDALNSAVYLARAAKSFAAEQELQVSFVSALGCDPLSDGMIVRWQAEGIDTQSVLRDPHHQPGLYMIQLDEQGERSFLYWRNDSAARYLLQHPCFPALEARLAEMDAIYISGISLSILPAADRQRLLMLLKNLHAQGKTLIFDSNYRPTLWENEQQARSCYQKMLALTTLALVTDDDERQLWGDADVTATLARLKQAGVREAVVKAGSQGCYYQDLTANTDVHLIAAQPVKNVVDTTSAGDAFNAGFLVGYLSGATSEQAAMMGHRLAGVVIQHQGAIIPLAATRAVTEGFSDWLTGEINEADY